MRFFRSSSVLFITMFVASFAHAGSESLEQIKFNCYAQTRFDAAFGEDAGGDTELLADQFRVSRVRIRASGKLIKTLSFFVQMDVASSIAIKDARFRVGCPKLPITFEVGRFTVPFGVEAQINPYWLTALDYSLPIHNKAGNGLIQGIWDVGAKIYGKHAVNEQIIVDYAAAVINGNTGGYTDTNKKKDYAGRLGVSLPNDISLGGSIYIGKAPLPDSVGDDVDKNRFGVDVKINPGPVLLQAEGLVGKNDDVDARGFYVLAAYKILPQVQLVGKYDFFDPDTDRDDDSTSYIRVGGNCFIAGDNQFQIFYQLSNNPGDKTGHSITAQLALVFEK